MQKLCYVCQGWLQAFDEFSICEACGTLRTIYNCDESQYNAGYFEVCLQYLQSPVNTPLNLSRLGIVSRWLKGNGQSSILDIGCNTGEFIRFAEPHYKCYGVEINETAAEFARSRCKSRIFDTLGGDFPMTNCVTLFDVIEHLEDPLKLLKEVYNECLEPGGILMVTTPNLIPYNSPEYIKKWKHYKPKEHLFCFTELGVRSLLIQSGLKLLYVGYEEADIRPGNPNRDIVTVVGRKI